MKKTLLALILCLSLFANTGCVFFIWDAITGNSNISERITDPQKYGEFHDSVNVPAYLPGDISNYTVNNYCYVIEKSAYLCYEIFLDITLSPEDFTKVLSTVTSNTRDKVVKGAFHSDKYNDVIFSDEFTYDLYAYVEKANIEKVIYSQEKSRIIFAILYVEENSLYHINNVEFFKKLNITPEAYASRKMNEF